jgi:hypothetical protein
MLCKESNMDTESAAKAAWNRTRVELPDAEPGAKATLPKTNIEKMLARGQLTHSEYALALRFEEKPCPRGFFKGRDVFYTIIVGIVLHQRTAEDLADPRVGRSKGIKEIMRKLRLGLRLMLDWYLPDDDDDAEGYGTPEWRTMEAKKLWSANMRRASAIKRAWRSMPKARRQMMASDMPYFRVRPSIK